LTGLFKAELDATYVLKSVPEIFRSPLLIPAALLVVNFSFLDRPREGDIPIDAVCCWMYAVGKPEIA
jgi:hypothetical protein